MVRGQGLPNAPADELVACSNGLVHVPTRTLYPHSPQYFVHHSVPFAFEPEAPAPKRWFAFLRDLWGGDSETIQTLQEVFGYLVSGDTRQQKIFLLVGPKRSGKGTIARVFTAMIGRHHVAGPTLAGLGTNFGLSPLIGKPVAIVSDARLGGGDATSVVTERLLSLSGEDTLTVDRKYREPWTGQLPSRLVILSNELPRLTDSSGALASRFIIMIMTNSFFGRENPALTSELCAELPSIFNWALDGLERLRERGHFQQPTASQDAVREMEDLGSPVGAFVRDCCVVGPACEVPCDGLYKHWCTWCEDHGRHKSSTQVFGRDLRAVLPGLKVEQPRVGEQRFRRYVGIGIRWNNDGPGRGPSRTTGADEAADARRNNNGESRVPPRASGAEEGLARVGTRATPMYSHHEAVPFVATSEWQDVPEHAVIPPGCQVEMDMATGRQRARRMPRGKRALAAMFDAVAANGAMDTTCAHCGGEIDFGRGYTATSDGRYLHSPCVSQWTWQ